MKCENCGKELNVGDYVVALQNGVIGTRDYIGLETTIFHTEACLRAYLDLGDGAPKEERIP